MRAPVLSGLALWRASVSSASAPRALLTPPAAAQFSTSAEADGAGDQATDRAFQEVYRARQSGRTATKRSAGSALHKYGRDLTREAAEGRLDPLIGRQDAVQRVLRVLMRKSKNNAVLVGEAGVGKTAVAEGLAQLLAGPVAPPGFAGKRMISLDVGSLVAGTQYRGAFEERLQAVLMEVRAARGGVLLFVDELHMLVNAGRTDGSMDAANLLKPALARGELHCLGATTPEEYRRHIEGDPAFARRFQPVHLEEPSVDEAVQWLRGLRGRYERHHRVQILDSALDASARCAKRYLPHRRLPDSAIDLLDEAAASARLRGQASGTAEWEPVVLPEAPPAPSVPGYMVWSTKAAQRPQPQPEVLAGERPWEGIGGDSGGAAPFPPPVHGLVWGGEVHYSSARPPRPCPHCAMPVKWQPPVVVQLKCPACNFRFLNVAPEQLMLGSSVVSPPSGGSVTRVALADPPPPPGHELELEPEPEPEHAHEEEKHPAPGAHPEPIKPEPTPSAADVPPIAAPTKRDSNGGAKHPRQRVGDGDAEAAAAARAEAAGRDHMRVTEEDVLQVVSLMTGLPLGELSEREHERLAGLAASLRGQMVGQDDAVQQVAATVQMSRLGLQAGGRPQGSFLFAGPPGVGKTMLAEQLAARVFGDSGAVVRLSGADFAERASISRLLGPPPGYVGFGQGGELTEPVRRRLHSLVIVDNVDAAHPEVQELLAQVLESGRLTDSMGRVADFTSAIVILTTRTSQGGSRSEQATPDSAGSLPPEAATGPNAADDAPGLSATGSALSSAAVSDGGHPGRRRAVLPALLDRVDDVVYLKPLGEAHLGEVVRMQVAEAQQLAQQAGLQLQVSPAVEAALVGAAIDSQRGAQPVARLVRQQVVAPLAQAMVAHRHLGRRGADGEARELVPVLVRLADSSRRGDPGAPGTRLETEAVIRPCASG